MNLDHYSNKIIILPNDAGGKKTLSYVEIFLPEDIGGGGGRG